MLAAQGTALGSSRLSRAELRFLGRRIQFGQIRQHGLMPSSYPVGTLPDRDMSRLHFGVFFDAEHAALSTDARLFEAAHGLARSTGDCRVDPCPARMNPAHQGQRLVDVLGPYARGETVLTIICDLQRLFRVAEGGDRQDRSENLFLSDAHIRLNIRQDGRRDVTPGQALAFSTTQRHRRALLRPEFEI